jgi:DNA polymerase-3 subunit beta
MPTPDSGDGIPINVTDLREMIQQVAFAASTDEARPILTGVLVTIDGDELTMASADGFRLSVRKANLSSPNSRPQLAVVPARALSELARIISDGDEVVDMILPPDRGQVVFQMKDFQLVSQLIEGTFPDYEQIIPRSKETRSVLSTSAFLKACKQAEIFAREGSHIARINITPGGELKPGSIMISGQSEETGSSQSEMDASIDGTPLLIAFNVRFLREVLEVVKTPEIALETSVDTAPGIIRPVGDENFLHVIMPMHLGS